MLHGLRKDDKMAAELKKRGLAEYQEGLAFLAFFAEPLPNLEEGTASLGRRRPRCLSGFSIMT